jgi:hypothetical protein
MQNGQIVRPEVATQIATAAQDIINTIKAGAQSKDQQFSAQALANGQSIYQAWQQYRGAFTSSYDDPNKSSQSAGAPAGNPLGLTPPK